MVEARHTVTIILSVMLDTDIWDAKTVEKWVMDSKDGLGIDLETDYIILTKIDRDPEFPDET